MTQSKSEHHPQTDVVNRFKSIDFEGISLEKTCLKLWQNLPTLTEKLVEKEADKAMSVLIQPFSAPTEKQCIDTPDEEMTANIKNIYQKCREQVELRLKVHALSEDTLSSQVSILAGWCFLKHINRQDLALFAFTLGFILYKESIPILYTENKMPIVTQKEPTIEDIKQETKKYILTQMERLILEEELST